MARITIEDCLTRIPNRFELTLAASNRARLLSTGAQPLLDPARDKPTVIALREIAAGKVGVEMLHKQTANKVSLAEAFSGDSLFTSPAEPAAEDIFGERAEALTEELAEELTEELTEAPVAEVVAEAVTEAVAEAVTAPVALITEAAVAPTAEPETIPETAPDADEKTP